MRTQSGKGDEHLQGKKTHAICSVGLALPIERASVIGNFPTIPLFALVIWILISLVVGGGVGSIVIAVKRKPMKKVAEIV